MRAISSLAIAAAWLLTACVTQVDGVLAGGAVWAVSRDDMRAAIAAYRQIHHEGKIYSVEIVGRNTINVYNEPNPYSWYVVNRIRGKWTCTGGVITTS